MYLVFNIWKCMLFTLYPPQLPSFFLWYISTAKVAVGWTTYVVIARLQPLLCLLPLASGLATSHPLHLLGPQGRSWSLRPGYWETPPGYAMHSILVAVAKGIWSWWWQHAVDLQRRPNVQNTLTFIILVDGKAWVHARQLPPLGDSSILKSAWTQHFPKFLGEKHHPGSFKNPDSWILGRRGKNFPFLPVVLLAIWVIRSTGGRLARENQTISCAWEPHTHEGVRDPA